MEKLTNDEPLTDEQRKLYEELREEYGGSMTFPLKMTCVPGKKNKPRNVASRKPVKR